MCVCHSDNTSFPWCLDGLRWYSKMGLRVSIGCPVGFVSIRLLVKRPLYVNYLKYFFLFHPCGMLVFHNTNLFSQIMGKSIGIMHIGIVNDISWFVMFLLCRNNIRELQLLAILLTHCPPFFLLYVYYSDSAFSVIGASIFVGGFLTNKGSTYYNTAELVLCPNAY